MKKVSLSLFVLATTVAALALMSCSSDDKVNNTLTGDPDDPQFVRVKAAIDSQMTPLVTSFVTSGMKKADGFTTNDLELGGPFGKREVPQNDSLSIVYHPLTGWWVGYLHSSGADEGTQYAITLHDSVQFRNANGYQIFPDSTTNYFEEIFRIDSLTLHNDSADARLSARSAMHFADLQTVVVTVNGNFNLNLAGQFRDSSGRPIDGIASVNFVTENLRVPRLLTDDSTAVSCPLSGTVAYTLTENFISQIMGEQPESNIWSIRITILDQHTYRVKVVLANIEWEEYTLANACRLAAGAPETPIAGLLGLLKTF